MLPDTESEATPTVGVREEERLLDGMGSRVVVGVDKKNEALGDTESTHVEVGEFWYVEAGEKEASLDGRFEGV